ncbi:Metalloenzyme, LuxS/M16 peptidase-like protein [Hyaloraphidium curvatum]|nr:Metalloenzyme, LuxS/M16 peptidase-like protein [Hyaloraphidium curvatum]
MGAAAVPRVREVAVPRLRTLALPLPGPLSYVWAIVPTRVKDGRGLPHTLEHLVFCGSRNAPHRGLLDLLAVRALSNGTNAYTTEDHTAYTLTAAGGRNLLKVLPTFLDHVLNPVLSDSHFAAEVLHVDGQGALRGVVHAEMAGRENTQADLLDRTAREAVFGGSTYAFECGGLTPEIEKLTNDQVKAYHAQWYDPDRLTLLLAGDVPEDAEIRAALQGVVGTDATGMNTNGSAPLPAIQHIPDLPAPPFSTGAPSVLRTVDFPSPDADTGSLSYTFLLPEGTSPEDLDALDVLGRWLCEDPSSILGSWTSLRRPRCEQVDWEVMEYPAVGRAAFRIAFWGVPFRGDGAEVGSGSDAGSDAEGSGSEGSWEDVEEGSEGGSGSEAEDGAGSEADEGSDMSVDSGSGASDDGSSSDGSGADSASDAGSASSTSSEPDLFAPSAFSSLLHASLAPLFAPDSPLTHAAVLPTLERHRRRLAEDLEDDPAETLAELAIPGILLGEGAGKLEGRVAALAAADALLAKGEKDSGYWKSVLQKLVWDLPCAEVSCRPSPTLAREEQAKTERERQARCDSLGPQGLEEMSRKAAEAKRAQETDVPPEVVAGMPPVPSTKGLPSIPAARRVVGLPPGLPFSAAVVVEADTAFSGIRLFLPTDRLGKGSRLLLPSLSELLFTTPMSDGPGGPRTWEEVSKRTLELFTSHFAGLGMSATGLSAGWLPHLFQIGCTFPHALVSESASWLAACLFGAVWDGERVEAVARNLESRCSESEREASDVAQAVLRSLACGDGEKGPGSANEVAVSTFLQKPFLKELVKRVRADAGSVAAAFDALRKELVAGTGGFLVVTAPDAAAGDRALQGFLNIWKQHVPSTSKANGKPDVAAPPSDFFPIPSALFDLSDLAKSLPTAMLVPLQGIATSYVISAVPCGLRPGDDDYLAVRLLSSLLSRTDGVLYSRIRGGGFAYGAEVSLSSHSGLLRFDAWECTDVRKALYGLWDVLGSIEAALTETEIEAARASLAFGMVEGRGTTGGAVWSAITGAVKGFKTLDEELDYESKLFALGRDDLLKVYNRYFRQFLDAKGRVLVAVVPRGSAKGIASECSSSPSADERKQFPNVGNGCAVEFGTVGLEQLRRKDVNI